MLHHVAGPNLPRAFRDAIDGLPIEEGVGACGTAAARRRPVVVQDTLRDPKTADFVEVATAHQLLSVWSLPLLDAQSRIVGTFALYRDHPYSPSPQEMAGVAALAGIAGLAIERFRTERALTEAAQRDPLTSLANRGMFNSLLAYALSYARQTETSCARHVPGPRRVQVRQRQPRACRRRPDPGRGGEPVAAIVARRLHPGPVRG